MSVTTSQSKVLDKFYSLIVTGYELPLDLVLEWFDTALGEYELELQPLLYDEESSMFLTRLSVYQISLLGRLMKREFDTREFSRMSKVTGIDTKDERVSGLQAAKQAVRTELDNDEQKIAELFQKIKEIEGNK